MLQERLLAVPSGTYIERCTQTPLSARWCCSCQEYSRQREYLERSVVGLKRKMVKDAKMQKSDYMRVSAYARMLLSIYAGLILMQ